MESELSRVVDALPGLVWTSLPDGHIDFLNQCWCEYTGLSVENALGTGWYAAIHPEDLPDLLARWQSTLIAETAAEMEVRLRRFDGEYRWFLVRARPLIDAMGHVGKWYGVNTDIEDRKRAEEALRVAEQRFRLIVDGLPALVSLRSPSGTLEYANRRALDYAGASIEELSALETCETIHPDDRASALEAWEKASETGQAYAIEVRRLGADGTYRWFHMQVSPLRDRDERTVMWYLLGTDIDDLRRARFQLMEEAALLEAIALGEPLAVTLARLCLSVESACPSAFCCSILLLDPETKTLWHAASPSVPTAYTESIDGFQIGPDVSSCGTAAYYAKQVVASDIATDPRWEDFRAIALSNGLQACWSTPILSRQRSVLGTFAMFSATPGTPSARDQEVISQVTHLASVAITLDRSQRSLTQALDKIKKSEAELRTTIDAIPGFVWSVTPDGSVDFLNQRWCDYTGVSLEQARGSGWEAAIHPDDAEQLMAYWQVPLATGEPGEYEARFRRFDGTYRWFLSKAIPLRNESGDIVKWYGLNTDIEDRKQAEALLAGEKSALEMVANGFSLTSVLKHLCELVEVTDTECHCSILLVDPQTQPPIGGLASVRFLPGAAPSLPPSLLDEIDGRPVDVDSGPCAMAAILKRQVISPDLATEERWPHWTNQVLSHGLIANWSTPILSSSGKVMGTFAVLYREPKKPSPDHQSLIARFTHIASIAIERAHSEAALKRSEAFLMKAQRLSSSGSFSWSETTGEIVWSEQVYRIFEFDERLPLSLELIQSRLHPDDMPLLLGVVERVNGGKDFEYEHRLRMADGSIKYLHTVAHLIHDQEGGSEYIGAVQDVTERRLSEEALSKVQSELAHMARVSSLGALAASIAHEVNQPLSGIITNASTCLRMLSATPANVEGALETARRTIRDGNRASNVIKRLRALFGKKPVAMEAVDLNEAAREVVALSWRELQRRRVTLHTELADDLPMVIGDRVQLQQVILNLLMNASDAMTGVDERKRQLLVRTELLFGDCVRLTVRDTGTGIAPQHMERLFDPFYTTKSTGMGIGLSISRSIIESHRGQLWATQNDGPGAAFTFSIPYNPEVDSSCVSENERWPSQATEVR